MYMYSRCTFLNGCQVVSYPDPNVCKHYAVQYYAHRFWPMNLFWSVRILMLQPELICPICKCFFSPTFPSQFTKSTHNIIWNHKTTKQYHDHAITYDHLITKDVYHPNQKPYTCTTSDCCDICSDLSQWMSFKKIMS